MGMEKTTTRVVLVVALAVGLLGVIASPAAAYPSITPTSHDFGAQQVGTTASPFTFVLRVRCLEDPANPGSGLCASGPEPLSPAITVPSGFTQTNDCPPTPPGNTTFGTTCNINVRFAPLVAGPVNGALRTGSDFAVASLTGTGVTPTQASPTPTTPATPTVQKKKCKKHRSAAAAKKRCKKKH
jgi:hypothetical protein